MNIMVVNCGSSSVKFAVMDPSCGTEILVGLCERLNGPDAAIRWTRDQQSHSRDMPHAPHAAALHAVVELLDQEGLSSSLFGIGHRVVHGGERFTRSVPIDDKVIDSIIACIPLGPLHNPANLEGIRQCRQLLPDLPHVAVFDTAFHQTMPQRAYIYPVAWELYQEQGVRRYGFHGTSHRYVAEQASDLLERPLEDLAVVTAHLGNGCSAAAILGGCSQDTTMGLTPLEGLMMGSRSGDVDPALHGFLSDRLGWDIDQVVHELNRNSGLLGLSGVSNDMRMVLDSAEGGNHRSRLAVEIFCYRLAKAVAALCVPMGRLDALVFAGGIGENAAPIRARVLDLLGFLNLRLDPKRNAVHGRGSRGRVTRDDATVGLVVQTNEEWMIAQDTAEIVADGGKAESECKTSCPPEESKCPTLS